MVLPFVCREELPIGSPHCFRVYEATVGDGDAWLIPLAEEYVRILTHREVRPVRRPSFYEDVDFDTARLRKYRKRACIPKYKEGNFNVVRSDFGELLCYMLLERDYNTLFGVKSIYDRELRDSTGRGIDAVGVEVTDKLTLVLCEVKVSDEQHSPPRVVDLNDDSLGKQHRYHMDKLKEDTADKVERLAGKVRDAEIAGLLDAAVLYLLDRKLDKVRIVACSVLVRPESMYTKKDFGSFKANPGYYDPAQIRFLIACIPDELDDIIRRWYDVVQQTEVSE
jgi:hypothetical protein